MKSPHYFEFTFLAEYIAEEIQDSQLQDVFTNDNGVVLSLYRFEKKPHLKWLIFDLDTQFPFVGLFDHNPWAGLKSTKPMGLFLKSNFHHNIVTETKLVQNFGRVLQIIFNTGFYLELRLIPKQPNLLAFVGKKQMAWSKPKELVTQSLDDSETNTESRSVPFMQQQWLGRRESIKKKSKDTFSQGLNAYDLWVAQRKKDIEKKNRALITLKQQIDNPKIRALQILGEHLKVQGFKNIPEGLISLVNFSQSISWNIQNSFDKSKQATNKIIGALKRAAFIEEELIYLQDLGPEKFQNYIKKQAQMKEFKSSRDRPVAEYRKLVLDEETGLTCLLGKSAADNLKLLRQSKSWDLWIHLKDYPGAHAIIFKNKNQKVSDEDVRKASTWLVRESVKAHKELEGTRLSVVIAECRHVRPIKGDKIGRVSYNHPREMLITI